MQLISPEDISPGDFEALQDRKCSDRTYERWCLNDFQPDGGCQWSGGRCDAKPRISSAMPPLVPQTTADKAASDKVRLI